MYNADGFIIKYDQNGDTLWTKKVPFIISVIESGSGFIVVSHDNLTLKVEYLSKTGAFLSEKNLPGNYEAYSSGDVILTHDNQLVFLFIGFGLGR